MFTESDAAGFDRFTQLHAVMSREIITVHDGTDAETIVRPADRRTAARSPPSSTATAASSACVTRKGALRSTIYRPALDADGRLMIAVAVGINGDPATKAKALVDAGRRRARHRHRPRASDADAAGASRRCARSRRTSPSSPATSSPPSGTRQLIEAGADIVKVGVGPGRDVHDADDDRRRAAAVLGGARVRRRGAPARHARLGRRRRALPARRRARARRRRGQRDVRLVARRHVRVGGRHAARPRRPALQGELRDGVATAP